MRYMLIVAGLAAGVAPAVAQNLAPPDTTLALDTSAVTADSADTLVLPCVPVSRHASAIQEWIPFTYAGGEEERYLRYLQVAGLVEPYPWSVRGFSPGESRRLSARAASHPWSGQGLFVSSSSHFSRLPLRVEIRHNSAFPFGLNDGAVWAGRGFTGILEGGGAALFGPVSIIAAPLVFRTQNTAFELFDGTRDGWMGDPLYGGSADRPQRFGTSAYGRFDPGQSTARVDLLGLTAGVSTANMVWGPMSEYPAVLGTNAAGIPHAFLGTARPVDLWIARLHGRAIWGRLEQSELSPVTGSEKFTSFNEPGRRRFASGLVASIMPRGLDGLEVGVARFFHSIWPGEGIPRSYYSKPFEGLFKWRLPEDSPEPELGGHNQVGSVFARLMVPAARLELYAEYGREDHPWDKRDLAQQPDFSRIYTLGARRVLHVSSNSMSAMRTEVINYQLPGITRPGRRDPGIYTHHMLRQGHTHRGQLLSSGPAVGAGAALMLAWDRYSPSGRSTLAVERTVRQDGGTFYFTGDEDPRSSDVQYGLTFERLRHLRPVELLTSATVIRNFNRDFRRDVWSSSITFRARLLPSRLR